MQLYARKHLKNIQFWHFILSAYTVCAYREFLCMDCSEVKCRGKECPNLIFHMFQFPWGKLYICWERTYIYVYTEQYQSIHNKDAFPIHPLNIQQNLSFFVPCACWTGSFLIQTLYVVQDLSVFIHSPGCWTRPFLRPSSFFLLSLLILSPLFWTGSFLLQPLPVEQDLFFFNPCMFNRIF